jgi:phage-related protein (TIGR01555 family)
MKFSNIFTADGFQNFAARLGLGAGSQNDQSTYGFDFLSRDRVKLEAMYRSSWVVGQVVDVVAEDMTREGVNLRGLDDPSDAEEIQRAMDDLEIWNEITNVIKWGRLYGGAIAVMLIDGQNVSTPLNIDTVGKDSFKGLMVLDRWLVQPTLQDLVSEYGPDFGMPKYYDVIADSLGLSNQRIHHSRVIRFDGVDLPYWQRVAENLWGQSVIERLLDRLIAFDSTTTGIAQLVYKAHLRTYKVKDLRKNIGMGGSALNALIKQIEHMRLWQSNEGITLMDLEDTFETHSYSFAGLDAVMLQFGQQLSGASQIPLVRLFGQSPSGMNATGESDLSNYYDNINQQQERRMRTGLGKLLKIVSLSTLGKALPDSFTFDFASLWQIDDVQKADIATKVTDAVCKAEEQGLISTQAAMKELRQSSEITGIYSNITDADIEAADDEVPKPQENYDHGENPPHTEPSEEGGKEVRTAAA